MKSSSFEIPLARLGTPPVLVDVGASGDPPAIWERIAPQSIYIGFDPDLREMREIKEGRFHRTCIVNKAVTWDASIAEAPFYLTRSPYCSSLLRPDLKSLSDYQFVDSFRVVKETRVPTATLETVIRSLGLDRVDWLKCDTQGADLRIFNSLPNALRNGVLALDIEPGLIHAYEGEDLFVDAHRELAETGFWISDLKIGAALRLRQATVGEFSREAPPLTESLVSWACKPSPAYAEARYLRSIAWLEQSKRDRRDYLLLWVFALLDTQAGFAMDLTRAYESQFGHDDASRFMKCECVNFFKRAAAGKWKARAKALLPPIVGRATRRFRAMGKKSG
ncbi:MAG: FkbM family methyltransferase [Nitrospirae bacterium]|nr:FkbM family methyltransferase [Nitrospirota bacterium]